MYFYKFLQMSILCFAVLMVGCRSSSQSSDLAELKNIPDNNGETINRGNKCGDGFDSKSIPEITPKAADPLVSRTILFELNIEANKVPAAIQSTPLENFLPKTDKVPGVVGTKILIGNHFGPNGSRRLVCLTDNSTAIEQVIENPSDNHFIYRVWNYSSKVAKPIEYAIGEFVATPVSYNKSQVKWTYSFKLKDNVFPGNLMAPGRLLFKKSFVDRDYANFMDSAAKAMQSRLIEP